MFGFPKRETHTALTRNARSVENKFFQSAGILVAGGVVGQAILVLIVPLLTRLYRPEDFGAFAFFSAILSVFLVISSLRYEMAIPLPRATSHAFVTFSLAVVINGIVSVSVGVVSSVFAEYVSRAIGFESASGLLFLLPCAIFAGGTYKALRFWALRHNRFPAIAWTKVYQSILNAVTQLLCGAIAMGPLGLALGHSVGLFAGAFRLAKGLRYYFQSYRRTLRLRIRIVLARYRRFPFFDVPAALINAIATQLPNLSLAVLFSPAVAGYFLLAEKVMGAPASMISQSVGQVVFARSREAIDKNALGNLVAGVAIRLALITFIPALIIFLAGADIFAFVLGSDWRTSGDYASYLVFGIAVQFVYSSLSLALLAIEAQALSLVLNLQLLFFKALGLGIGYALEDAQSAVILYAVATGAGYLIAIAMLFQKVRRRELQVGNRMTD